MDFSSFIWLLLLVFLNSK